MTHLDGGIYVQDLVVGTGSREPYASREYGNDKDGFRLVARLGFVVPLESIRARRQLP